jgi:UDP:flavonoid glycosyltransferase YjiC (YdhE family)
MRPVPYDGGGEVPDWLASPSERPRILVSRSTVAAPGRDRLMSAVVRAAGAVAADVVLVRPDQHASAMTLPDNVRSVDWVPIATVLRHRAGG